MNPGYIDAHCHLAHPSVFSKIGEILEESQKEGVTNFLMAGIGPEDWRDQLAAIQRHPNSGLIACFGLHPWWVHSHARQDCLRALQELRGILNQSAGIGEMGLDFFKERGDSKTLQQAIFADQVALANEFKKVAVLHVVKAHSEALNILKRHPLVRGGLIHGFTGDERTAEAYLDLGFYVSVGKNCPTSIKCIPMDRILIESDCDSLEKRPILLKSVAKKIGTIMKRAPEEMLDISRSNLLRLFGQDLNYGEARK